MAKAKASGKTVTLVETVLPEDRLTHEEVIGFMKELIRVENIVNDPIDDIQAIFEKIKEWKDGMGDEET